MEIQINYKKTKKKILISSDDFEMFNLFNWCIWSKNNKWGTTYYYLATKTWEKGKAKTLYYHHLVTGNPINKKFVIDHINRNTLDNRRSNLRIATRRENLMNSDKPRLGRKRSKKNNCKCGKRSTTKTRDILRIDGWKYCEECKIKELNKIKLSLKK